MDVSSWENHLFLWVIYTMALLNNQRVFTPPQKMDLATLKLLQALSVRRVRADAYSFGAVLGKTKMAPALLTWMKDERTVFLQMC
jgi:hypothetical protein